MLNDFASSRANFYRQLAGLEDAGIPLRQALAKVRVTRPALKHIKEHLLAAAERGEDMGKACASAPGLLPFESQMVVAATQVGRLSETWRELAEYFEDKAAARRELLNQLSYPIMVMHVAIFLPPLYILFTKGMAEYLQITLPAFGILWGAIIGIPFLIRRLDGSALLDGLLWHLPIVAGAYRANARRTALSILRTALSAGLIADVAFDAAAKACPSAGMRAELHRASQEARSGMPLPQIIDQLTTLPEVVRDGMATGAESGSLPEVMARLEKQLAEEAKMRQKIVFTLLGILVFLAVAAMVAVKVIGFWTEHYKNVVGS